jgi:hypothetical protein
VAGGMVVCTVGAVGAVDCHGKSHTAVVKRVRIVER